ncbi:MAG: selenocysteine-specific translation elongation factor [Candidatus Latescibacteria bacterium]|nr:selenocysteine-specific translation elongation factor [Candidatus Latescibacterota bacterium]
MRPVVVGTAGHIDHGKTALVRRLTGIDTDRLKEEKERGISIDLGFAHRALPSGQRLAIVDVPGHERFVKNMLAGATGVDLVLLVVAADEGVMPQTREHLAIVNLLHVDRGIAAITKTDLVDPDTVAVVKAEVEALLKSTPLRDIPVVPVSSVTGEGIDALVEALERAASEARGRDSQGPARLPVDRVFPVEGIGTVVTGTLWSGTVRPGDSLELLPAGRAVRVRQIQIHDESVNEAAAGRRVALAIHGVSRDEVERGDWLATPGRYRPSHLLDVRLALLDSAPKTLGSRARLRLHLGASEILGRAVLLDRDALAPGAECWAQLRLEKPAVASAGDRIVIRSYSPAATIGGATVVDPTPPKRARASESDLAGLEILRSGSALERIATLAVERGSAGLTAADAAARLNLSAGAVADATASAAAPSLAVGAAPGAAPGAAGPVPAPGPGLTRLRDGRFLATSAWSLVIERIVREVKRYGEANRLRDGIGKGELKSLLKREMPATVFDEALEALLAESRLFLRGDRVSLPEAMPSLNPDQVRALAEIERRLSTQGFQVPEVSELLRLAPASARPQELIRYLVDSGRAVKVTSELLYPSPLWEEVERRVRGHFRDRPTLNMGEFKELLHVSRKFAVPILEHLDRSGLTRREGDLRLPGPRLRD